MTIFILSIVFALCTSFLCSLMEACLLSLSQADVARLSETKPRAAEIWKRFKLNIQKPIAVILIINTLAHTIGAAISGAQFDKLFGSKWIALYSLIFSLVMIQWTEILPKTLGVRFNRALASIAAQPLSFLVILFKPLVFAVELINKPFQAKQLDRAMESVEDINVLARSAALDKQISREQEKLISRSLQMSKMQAREVMVDRREILTLSSSMTLTEGLIAAHVHRHTRFPLVEDNDIDKILGYVNFKDIVGALHMNPKDPSLKGIKRDILFVDENMLLPELLIKLTRGYQHIAIVQDSNNKTMGLITLEDLIETLVGELEDEYDVPPDMIVQLAENRYRVGGGARLATIRLRAFSDAPEDDTTVGEWLTAQLGKNIKEQSSFTYGKLQFRVRRITRGHIHDIIIERKP